MNILPNLLSSEIFRKFTYFKFASRKANLRKNCNVLLPSREIHINRFCSAPNSSNKSLTIQNMNQRIIKMEYAVRGPLLIRAGEIEKELQQGVKKPFTEVIRANLGDCQAMGQIPITFLRQVVALATYPKLLDDPQFPPDAKERAKLLLSGCKGRSVGSYSDSPGIEIIRKHVADYIQQRDGGIPSSWQDISLSTGASNAIKDVLKLMINDFGELKAGIMTPVPEYPLYAATLTEFGIVPIGYQLDESKNWGLNVSSLQSAIDSSRKVAHPRAIVVINPGNPTGQVLTEKNIQDIIKFAHKEKLFILADEVYQDNIYDPQSRFFSFKKVLTQMGKPYSEIELASFMSCSKGYMGECGLRAGYSEIINLHPDVKKMFSKSITTGLCSSVLGQIAMDVVVNPPKKGDPSYEQFIKEKTAVLESLKTRAKMISETFNSFRGFRSNIVQGAMYAFPQIDIPPKAIEEAKKQKKQPDAFYAFELLENTGICVVPGSGFGQAPGTFHFRTTILMQTEKLKVMLEKLREFHYRFVEKYS